MAYVNTLYESNFLEYASYVIKDRAIPHIHDGLKPVQRRIIHSLFEMDDGKFHKVANVVGHCMKYHPHGDASIYSALVVLANKELFIDRQGNFGNIFTGDQASAARYIECRVLPLAKELLYKPEITEFTASYDGRNKEPVTFPAKIPFVLILGAEGIAVGMSTRILPHNFNEVLECMVSALKGEKYELYPDFPTGGMIDVSEYNDGLGKILVRAKFDTKDPKKIVIKELPFGSTTESLISSIENAARRNKVKIAGISDYTTEEVEIEIKLARGVYSQDVIDALYAFTDCETSISVNPLVIEELKPVIKSVTEIIEYHAERLVSILKAELEIEQGNLRDRLHARTLEQIFVEERIYKEIEEMATGEAVIQAVIDGFKPFASKIRRKVTEEDVERLLKIPIRRISLYDINKAKKEIREINSRLKKIAHHLENLTDYSISFLEGIKKNYGNLYKRKSEITSFERVDVREAAERNLELRYDSGTGYLGYGLKSGKVIIEVSPYDRILVIRKSGVYSVIDVPEKLFVDKGMLACGHADKDILSKRVFSIIYRNNENKSVYLKRCKIEQFIIDKSYSIVPEKCTILKLTSKQEVAAELTYKPKPRLKVLEETFPVKEYLVKSVRASGVKLTDKEVRSAKFITWKGKKKKN
jgi:topoisomerase IV subunit A